MEAMSDKEGREKKEPDLSSALVLMKYQAASRILNEAMKVIVSECKPKAKIVKLCESGDSYIKEKTSKIFTRTTDKGLAFPTCVSVNNMVCHFSPLATDNSVLEENDVVKIDMSCQIDGFMAVLGHTHVITNGRVMGRSADVLAAANTAAEVAMRLVAPGNKKKDVTEAIQKVAVAFDCRVLGDFHCYRMKKSGIYGNKFVLDAPSADTKVDDSEFEENEVYAIDITTSTGEGKPYLLDKKQTDIYKLSRDNGGLVDGLGKSALYLLLHIRDAFGDMPFTARALDETDRAAFLDLIDGNCLEAYPVLHEKPGDLVAHIKFTVLLRPNGSEKITHPLQDLHPTKSLEENAEIKEWLSLPMNGGRKMKKGKTEDGAAGSTVNIPGELLFKVFTHLEPWWFFRCSSVAKTWHTLITCKDNLNLRHGRQHPRPMIMHMTKLNTLHNSNDVPSFKLETVDLQSQKSCLIANFTGATATKKYSFQMTDCFKVHGSCRGVLLMSFHEHLYLCNPMTRCWAQFEYVHRAGDMLCLYHHSGTDEYRILKKEDSKANSSCTYSVIELDPERNSLRQRQVCQRSYDLALDPAPVQVGDCVYWAHVLNGEVSISVFDATCENLHSIPVPQLTERQVIISTEVLVVEDQLAVSVACGSAQIAPLEGPSSIELWKYKNSTWEFDVRVHLPDTIKDLSDMQVHFGLGNGGWKAFITDGDGNVLVHVADKVLWCDKNGRGITTLKGDNSKQQLIPLRLMLKESLLPHRMLPRRYDVENLDPPFFINLASSDTTLSSVHKKIPKARC